MAKPFTVTMRSVGNPDHGQYAPLSEPETATRPTLAAISAACREYIERWDLGGGNWPNTPVYQGKQVVGWVSYNGKVWPFSSDLLADDQQPLFTPKEV